jgi:hypothetical protein
VEVINTNLVKRVLQEQMLAGAAKKVRSQWRGCKLEHVWQKWHLPIKKPSQENGTCQLKNTTSENGTCQFKYHVRKWHLPI